MVRFLEAHGFQPHVPSLRPSSGRTGLEELARQLAAYIAQHLDQGTSFNLVGFSMGGLISRYYLQRLDGMQRVRRFITLSTPHNGSRLAYLLANLGGRQMRPGSPFLADLNRDVQNLDQVGIVSIWTPLDLMILPPSSSRLPVGLELRLPVVLHALMVRDQRSLAAVARFLSE